MDTIVQECIDCHNETDCIKGLCLNCSLKRNSITPEREAMVIENERLRKRDCNATIVLCYDDGNNPFAREELKVIDVGVSDNIYVVESQIVKELFDKLKAGE